MVLVAEVTMQVGRGVASRIDASQEGVKLMRKSFAVLAAVAALALIAPAANASGDMYGSLAYDSGSGSYGWAVDYHTQSEANKVALDQCGSSCEVVMEFQNTCAAFATGAGTSYGWAYASTKEAAQSAAIGYCSERGSGCSIKVWACTTR